MRRFPATPTPAAAPPRAGRAVAQSLGVHAVVAALLAWAVRAYTPPPRAHAPAPALEFSPLAPPPARPAELALVYMDLLQPPPPPPASSVPPAARTTPAAAPPAAAARGARSAVPDRGAHTVLPPEPAAVAAAPEPAVTPAPAAAAPSGPRVNALDVLASRDRDATRVAAGGRAGLADVAPRGDDSRDRVVAASRGYLRSVAAEGALARHIEGSWPYYRHVRDAARRAWRRVPVPEPSMVDAVLGSAISDVSTAQRVAAHSLGPRAGGRSHAAGEALDFAHPNSPLVQGRNTMGAIAEATARVTRAEIEVDQSETGAVVAVRVVRPSGTTGFDRSAIDAVQAAVAELPARRMPGGWTSRWEFTVTVTRDPPITALPGAPGDPVHFGPQAGADFDEVTGEVIPRVPFMVHTRRLVRVVSSRRTAP